MTERTVRLDNVDVTEEQLLDKLYELQQLAQEELVEPGTTAKFAVVGGYRVALDRDSVVAAAKECEENAALVPVLRTNSFVVETARRRDVIAKRVSPISIGTR